MQDTLARPPKDRPPMPTLANCPTDCPLAAFVTGRYVRIDLDNLDAPANRKVPRRCRRCHRMFTPGARGPLPLYCGKKCVDAAKKLTDRRERAAVRMPAY